MALENKLGLTSFADLALEEERIQSCSSWRAAHSRAFFSRPYA